MFTTTASVRADENAFQWLIRIGVDFLVRTEWRHENEVAGLRLGHVLEAVAPAQARPASYHVDHAFELSVVMHPRLRIGLD